MSMIHAFYSNYRDEVVFYGGNLIVVVLILLKFSLVDFERHRDDDRSDVNNSDAFKAYVFLCFGTAFPMTIDVVIDLFSSKSRLWKQLLARGFICWALLLSAGLHFQFSMKKGGDRFRVNIMILFVSMLNTTVFYQLKQRNVKEIVSTWKYFVAFAFHHVYALLRVYESNTTMFAMWNMIRVLAYTSQCYIAGKHLYVTVRGSVEQDWHQKCQVVAFEIVLVIILILSLMIRFLNAGGDSQREDPEKNGIIAYSLLMYVGVTLVELIITNDHRNQYAKLEQKLVVKRKFVSYVSHEVRTPLNNCALGINYMKNTLENPTKAGIAEVREVLDEVDEGCRTAVDFMNNLLLYEKIDSMDLPLYMDRGDLGVVCSEVVSSFQMSARHLEISLELNIHDSLLLTPSPPNGPNQAVMSTALSMFDYGKVVIVFRNLLSNALKFTPKHGRVSLTVLPVCICEVKRSNERGVLKRLLSSESTVKSIYGAGSSSTDCIDDSGIMDGRDGLVYLPPAGDDNTTHYRVILSDTGRGMSPAEQKQLFKKIVQFSPNENQNGGGSGIGLFLSHQIMTRHGLEIQVYSDGIAGTGGAVGGTHFYVDFPVSSSAPDDSHMMMKCAGRDDNSADLENNKREQGCDNDDEGGGGRRAAARIMELCGSRKKVAAVEDHQYDGEKSKCDGDDDDDGESVHIPTTSSLSTISNKNVLTGGDDDVAALNQSTRVSSRKIRMSCIRHKKLSDLSILVVDDSVINRKMVTRTLLQHHIGSIIEGVGDGTELLSLLGVSTSEIDDFASRGTGDMDSNCGHQVSDISNNDTYDVILLDDHMTHMDGSIAVKKLRHCGYRGLVIGVTGSATDEDMQEFCEAGVDFALPKPFILKDFLIIVNSQL